MRKDSRNIWQAVTVAGLLMIAYSVDMFDDMTSSTVVMALLWAIRNVIHISLLITWGASLYQRIINVRVRRCLVSVSMLMIFWLTVKIIKWDFLPNRMFWLGRYLWYGFYIPMILIPLLGVFVIGHIGKPEGYQTPRWMNLLYIPAFAILIGIFTNDLHQLAFSFPEGIEWFDYTYGYGPVYFAAMAWFVLGGIYIVVMLLKKSRVPGSKKMQKLPAIIMGGAVVFWTLYCFGIFRGADLTVVDCLIISFLLESAIQSGLIPSNTKYHAMFRASTIAAQIVDREYQPCFVSACAAPMTHEQMRRIGEQPVKIAHKVLRAKPIKTGYVLWQDDVAELDEMMRQLWDVQQQLNKENELMQAELLLKEQRTQVEEKSRLYDRIAKDVAPQLRKIDTLLEQSSDPLMARSAMVKMCVIGSYVKRRSNLLLLGEENQTVPARELEYCIRESLDNLMLAEVFTMLKADCDGMLPLEHIIAVYDFFENLTERLIDQINAMMVQILCENGSMKMNLQIGCVNNIAAPMLEDLDLPFGSVTYTLQEEDLILDLQISAGGVYKW